MNRGYYTAAQGMINQQRILDAISNNVINSNTAGYKKDQVTLKTFQEELFLINSRTETAGTYLQTCVDKSKTNLEQGAFEYTESRFDMAIYGNVYFNLKDSAGNIFQTRNGQFTLDNDGYLCLGTTGRVQGENGDIYLGNDDFVVAEDGTITNDEGVVDKLSLTYIPAGADVTKIGDSLFSYAGGETLPASESYVICQGAFEKANIDATKEMTQAIQAQRMYEASSKILQYLDKINSNSASSLAQI